MVVSVDIWPKQWNEGARSSVEPFLHSFLGIELSGSWRWLVAHNELAGWPAESYSPLLQGRAHLVVHPRAPCRACGVWRLLVSLWQVVAELYEKRDVGRVLRKSRQLRRLIRRTDPPPALQRAPPDHEIAALHADVEHKSRAVFDALERYAAAILQRFSPDAQLALRGGGRLLNVLCRRLHDGGFSYAEIANLIGDRGHNPADRIRKRCKRARE